MRLQYLSCSLLLQLARDFTWRTCEQSKRHLKLPSDRHQTRTYESCMPGLERVCTHSGSNGVRSAPKILQLLSFGMDDLWSVHAKEAIS